MIRILAVDDDGEILEMYKKLLSSEKEVEYVSFTCPIKAFTYINYQIEHIQIMIIDLGMHCLDGDKLIRLTVSNYIKDIIVITGSDKTPIQGPSITYFRKPLAEQIPAFLGLIQSLVAKHKGLGHDSLV